MVVKGSGVVLVVVGVGVSLPQAASVRVASSTVLERAVFMVEASWVRL
jgi:hypothetical protein